MSDFLSPRQAAKIASGVYQLQYTSLAELRENKVALGCEDGFEPGDGARFEGKSGALFMKKTSGFGYVAEGKPGTPFEGDMLVATRGTLGSKLGPDWFSNYNIGVQLGPSMLPVHAGFNEVWKTFVDHLDPFFKGRRPPRRVHCVGHSLGGALATLNADYLTVRYKAPASLYTFGAPRVGDAIFARALTARVGPEFIQRVYHPSDPVPMIPLFPFWHTPFGRSGLPVTSMLGGLVNADAHSMENSYVPMINHFAGWGDLRSAAAERADEAAQVKSWLEMAADGRGGFLMGSASLLSMIGRALGWLLKQTGRLMFNAVGAGLVAGVSMLDQLAWSLTQGAQVSMEMGRHVKTLIGAIWAFLGRKMVQVAEVTVAFLRWVLELLFSSLRALVERALSFLI